MVPLHQWNNSTSPTQLCARSEPFSPLKVIGKRTQIIHVASAVHHLSSDNQSVSWYERNWISNLVSKKQAGGLVKGLYRCVLTDIACQRTEQSHGVTDRVE